jgi:hypothetical protein
VVELYEQETLVLVPGNRVVPDGQDAARPGGVLTVRPTGPDRPLTLVSPTVPLPVEPAVNETVEAKMLKSIISTVRTVE